MQKPKRSRGYCFGCDGNWIIPGVKCSVCGRIGEGRRKFKKHAPTVEEFDYLLFSWNFVQKGTNNYENKTDKRFYLFGNGYVTRIHHQAIEGCWCH